MVYNKKDIGILSLSRPDEYCGYFIKNTQKTTEYYITNKGYIQTKSGRKVCSLKRKYVKEFHTHPKNTLFYPSVKDLLQPLKHINNMQYSQIFGTVYNAQNKSYTVRWTLSHIKKKKKFTQNTDNLQKDLREELKKFYRLTLSKKTGLYKGYQMKKDINKNCSKLANNLSKLIRNATKENYTVNVNVWPSM